MKRISFISVLYLLVSLHMISFSQETSFKQAFKSDTQKLEMNDIFIEFTKQIENFQEKLRNLKEFKDLLPENDYMKIKQSNEIAIQITKEQLALYYSSFNTLLNEKLKNSKPSQEILNRSNQVPDQSALWGTMTTPNSAKAFLQLDLNEINDLGASEAAKYASACLKGALASIPPSFCYKQNGDVGVIPTNCPEGYFRSLALCYENCKSGMKFVAGVCWEDGCKPGYYDFGATCTKCTWSPLYCDTYAKYSYISPSITNFDSRVTCPSNMYHSGALCYRDCNKAGLVNCGIGACAASSISCAAGIAIMTIDFVLGAIQLITFIISFGASSASKASFDEIRSSYKNIAASTLESGLTTIARIASNSTATDLLKKSTVILAKSILKPIVDFIVESLVAKVCEEVIHIIFNKASNKAPIELNLSSLDPTNITNAIKDCKNIQTENDKLMCAKSVLNTISTVDVTGLTAMAAALIQNTCPWI